MENVTGKDLTLFVTLFVLLVAFTEAALAVGDSSQPASVPWSLRIVGTIVGLLFVILEIAKGKNKLIQN